MTKSKEPARPELRAAPAATVVPDEPKPATYTIPSDGFPAAALGALYAWAAAGLNGPRRPAVAACLAVLDYTAGLALAPTEAPPGNDLGVELRARLGPLVAAGAPRGPTDWRAVQALTWRALQWLLWLGG